MSFGLSLFYQLMLVRTGVMHEAAGVDSDQILTDAQLKCQGWGKIQLGSGGRCKPPQQVQGRVVVGARGGSPWKLPDFQRFETLRSALLFLLIFNWRAKATNRKTDRLWRCA